MKKPFAYELKSDDKKKIYFFSEHLWYAGKADKLVEIALKSGSDVEFAGKVAQYPSLTGAPLTDRIVDLMKNKKDKRLQDEVYLLSCLFSINDQMAAMDGEGKHGHEYRACERYNAITDKQTILRTLESLKS